MQFRNGLALFSRTNSKGHWNIASWHSPHSLTWSWIVSFSLFRGDEARVRPLWWSIRRGHSDFRIPFLGMVSWQTQRPMWYRDLWHRRRDEEDFGPRDRQPEAVPPPLPNTPASTSVH